jgi:hypothetical protein
MNTEPPPYINAKMLENIVQELRGLEEEYQQNQALLLTVDDFQCHLFNRIRSCFPPIQR